MKRQPGTVTSPAPAAEPVALVLSRQARPGHERAFEEVLHSLAGAVRGQPGHLDVTVLRPAPGGPPIYTIVSHFRTRADADVWLAAPGAPVLVPPAQRKTTLVSAAGILPLLELVSYLLSLRLAALPAWRGR